MIDSHTHLDSLRHVDPDTAVANAQAAGVHGMLTIGSGIESIRGSLAIAARHPGVVQLAAAVHPQAAAGFDLAQWDEVCRLVTDPGVVMHNHGGGSMSGAIPCAIGETGLDQYRDYGPLDVQLELFRLHMQLARDTRLPLVIHTRAAARATLDALADHPADLPVVLHCFSMADELDEVLERGYWCSFAGNVTYPSASDLRDAAARVPRERLLVETDAPYLAPVPMRGKPNEPAWARHTLAFLAGLRGDTIEQAEAYTNANAAQLFGFPNVPALAAASTWPS